MRCRFIKKILSCFCIIILSINSYAAIVTDNDGSAFVTKAEFQALQDAFNEQIEKYNQSFETKIDGAIANYLAGINRSQLPINYIREFDSAQGYMPIWYYDFSKIGNATVVADEVITQDASFCRNMATSIEKRDIWVGFPRYADASVAGGYKHHGYWMAMILTNKNNPTWSGSNGYGNYAIASVQENYDWTNRHLITQPNPNNLAQVTFGSQVATNYAKNNTSTSYVDTNTGSGSGWIYQNISGRKCLKYYATEIYPRYFVNVDMHYYKDYQLTAANGPIYLQKDKQVIVASSLPTISTWPKAKMGYTVASGTRKNKTDAANGNYIDVKTLLKKNTDNNNYLNYVWGLKTDVSVYAIDEDYNGVEGTTLKSITTNNSMEYNSEYWTGTGKQEYTTKYPTETVKYYPLKYVKENLNWSSFSNNYFSVRAGLDVRHGDGIPLCEVLENEHNIRMALKLSDTTSATADTTCKVTIASEKFNLGNAVEGTVLDTFELHTNETTPVQRTFLASKGPVWIFIENLTNSNPIEMTTCNIQ